MGDRSSLRRMFLSEFAPGLRAVRSEYRAALTQHERAKIAQATQKVGEHCHRMGGVAQMVGYPLAGEVAALCEALCKLPPGIAAVDVAGLVGSALDRLAEFFDAEESAN